MAGRVQSMAPKDPPKRPLEEVREGGLVGRPRVFAFDRAA